MNSKKKSQYLVAYMMVLSVMVIMIHNQTLDALGKRTVYSGINSFLINVLEDGILDIAVPGFFFISGYLHFRKYVTGTYGTMLKKKARTLMIPYILWNFIGLAYAYCVSNIAFLKQFSSMVEVQLSLKTVFEALFFYKYNTVGWYMLSLMGLMIFSPVIEWCISKKRRTVFFLVVLCVYYLCFYRYSLIRDFGTLSFVLGGIAGKNKADIVYEECIFKVNNITAAAMFFVIAVLRMLLTNIGNSNTVILLFDHLLKITMLLFMWNLVSGLVKKTKKVIGNYSFPIYVMHWYVLSIVQKLFIKIIPGNNVTVWIIFWGSTLLSTVVIILIARLWEKILPRMYGWFMGGR